MSFCPWYGAGRYTTLFLLKPSLSCRTLTVNQFSFQGKKQYVTIWSVRTNYCCSNISIKLLEPNQMKKVSQNQRKVKKKELRMPFYLLFELCFNTLPTVNLIILLLKYRNSRNYTKPIKIEIEQGTQKENCFLQLRVIAGNYSLQYQFSKKEVLYEQFLPFSGGAKYNFKARTNWNKMCIFSFTRWRYPWKF